jgi:hypothetical protein
LPFPLPPPPRPPPPPPRPPPPRAANGEDYFRVLHRYLHCHGPVRVKNMQEISVCASYHHGFQRTQTLAYPLKSVGENSSRVINSHLIPVRSTLRSENKQE